MRPNRRFGPLCDRIGGGEPIGPTTLQHCPAIARPVVHA